MRRFTIDKNVARSFRVKDTDFTRERKLSLCNVAAPILSGWKMSIQNRINRFFHTLGLLGSIPTASAFCQAREKIKPEFFKALNEETIDFFYSYDEGEPVKR